MGLPDRGKAGPAPPSSRLAAYLEGLYRAYNRRCYVAPDPLQFLYDYPHPHAQEVVGLVASALAYGRVAQILRSVGAVLERMGDPLRFLELPCAEIAGAFGSIRHRFTSGREIGRLMVGVKRIREEFGSLGACFAACGRPDDPDLAPPLDRFLSRLAAAAEDPFPFLLPRPSRGSACKRPFLYLRWMVRRDQVDPGCWNGLPGPTGPLGPGGLLIPLDTHMAAIGRRLRAISTKGASLAAARRLTRFFAQIDPNDPVKYDFCLTRFGIREEMSLDHLHFPHHRRC